MAIELLIQQELETPESGEITTLDRRGVYCPKCKSVHFKKDGTRKRKRRHPAQRYKCLNPECGKRFTDKPEFKGRHNSSGIILMSILLFGMGTSLNGIVLVLNQCNNVSIYGTTVQRRMDHYVALVEKYTDTLRPKVSRVWSCDEKFTRVAGADHWWFTVRDIGTRFILSWKVAPKKTNYDAKGLFRVAEKMVGRVPIIFKTDGLTIFRTAFRAVFSKISKLSIHQHESHIRNEYSTNNGHERLNGTWDEILHGTRGMQKADASLYRAAIIHYNFVRPHQALHGKTPAHAAGIVINDHNVWRILIQHATLAAA